MHICNNIVSNDSIICNTDKWNVAGWSQKTSFSQYSHDEMVLTPSQHMFF